MPVTVPVNAIDVDEPEHMVRELFVGVAEGIGFTTTVSGIAVPVQVLFALV